MASFQGNAVGFEDEKLREVPFLGRRNFGGSSVRVRGYSAPYTAEAAPEHRMRPHRSSQAQARLRKQAQATVCDPMVLQSRCHSPGIVHAPPFAPRAGQRPAEISRGLSRIVRIIRNEKQCDSDPWDSLIMDPLRGEFRLK